MVLHIVQQRGNQAGNDNMNGLTATQILTGVV